METSSQCWKPVWYLLEDRGFELQLVNAKHVRMVPGGKTDLADAAWLAELLDTACRDRRSCPSRDPRAT
jgi:transposase